MVWDGTAWSTVYLAIGSDGIGLSAVSCVSETSCVATGVSQHYKKSPEVTLTVGGGGTTFARVSSPNPKRAEDAWLAGVSCVTPTGCVAVGGYQMNEDQFGALAMVSSGPYVLSSPSSGPAGQTVAISGGGFNAGETINVSYQTRLPKPSSAPLCKALADSSGQFSCTGSVPTGTKAGPLGAHAIKAKGVSSHIKASTTFTLS